MGEYRRFVLQRNEDISGVSGTGVVAEGVEFSNGVVALHWVSEFPTSVVFHHRGMESVEHVHGHSGATQIVWLDDPPSIYATADPERWSNVSRGDKRLTWRELAEDLRERLSRAEGLVQVLSDLDRCEHGRHEGDVCSSCGGPSLGNPIAGNVGATSRWKTADRQIGFDMAARPIVVPRRDVKHRDADAWIAK